MTKAYPSVKSGQEVAIDWVTQDYLIACCDCHLVHRFKFTVEGDKLIIQGWRDNRRTAALRYHRGVPIKDNENEQVAEDNQQTDSR